MVIKQSIICIHHHMLNSITFLSKLFFKYVFEISHMVYLNVELSNDFPITGPFWVFE